MIFNPVTCKLFAEPEESICFLLRGRALCERFIGLDVDVSSESSSDDE